MVEKDSFDFCRHSNGILLALFRRVRCLEKGELKILVFCLKSTINPFS